MYLCCSTKVKHNAHLPTNQAQAFSHVVVQSTYNTVLKDPPPAPVISRMYFKNSSVTDTLYVFIRWLGLPLSPCNRCRTIARTAVVGKLITTTTRPIRIENSVLLHYSSVVVIKPAVKRRNIISRPLSKTIYNVFACTFAVFNAFWPHVIPLDLVPDINSVHYCGYVLYCAAVSWFISFFIHDQLKNTRRFFRLLIINLNIMKCFAVFLSRIKIVIRKAYSNFTWQPSRAMRK